MLQWSGPQRFRTDGRICPLTETVGNSITVLHADRSDCPSRTSDVLTWLTSPDWPGVIWADSNRSPQRWTVNQPKAGTGFIAHYSGLPPSSDFTLTIQQPLPHAFRQAPSQSLEARTGRTPLHVTAPGVHPSDIAIRVVADQIIVEWTNQEPFLVGYTGLYTQADTTRYWTTQWRQDGDREVRVYSNLGGQRTLVLYVSFYSSERLGDGSAYPSMCLIREITLTPAGLYAHLDRLFRYSGAQPASQEPQITPVEIPRVFVDFPYRYHHAGRCELAAYAYP